MRFLLHQGLIYCGDDEYEGSNNEGVFLGLWNFHCGRHEELKVITLRNSPLSLKLTSPDTQKDIITTFSVKLSMQSLKILVVRTFPFLSMSFMTCLQ
ncbi:hypothetical protein C1H46_013435 [Malus baccata]|uniref:DUF4371 domain-containing protein n=1 Tax=Malus baccata TaxID=106549 RepID=A0A540MQ42_MALBA|nr:hypothetical protein C1H46_013435 [Malus baccata]